MALKAEHLTTKPLGWEKLTPLGKGDPEVGFCSKERRNYTVDRNGNIIWHGVPDGFEFDNKGNLIEKVIREDITNG